MNYSDDIFEKLVATIEEATSQAAIDLFNSTNETFYFFVLSTTGEALAPFVSAWSYEALKKQSIAQNWDAYDIVDFKWSSIDSPYLEFGSQYFHQVNQAFLDRIDIHSLKTEVEYEKEILKVSLPLLIPHRKEVYTNFIYKPLHIALQNWYLEQVKSDREIPSFEECMVCFVHVYDKRAPTPFPSY